RKLFDRFAGRREVFRNVREAEATDPHDAVGQQSLRARALSNYGLRLHARADHRRAYVFGLTFFRTCIASHFPAILLFFAPAESLRCRRERIPSLKAPVKLDKIFAPGHEWNWSRLSRAQLPLYPEEQLSNWWHSDRL